MWSRNYCTEMHFNQLSARWCACAGLCLQSTERFNAITQVREASSEVKEAELSSMTGSFVRTDALATDAPGGFLF